MDWINVKERLPESGQEVLTYFYDKSFDIHQIDLLDYFEKGEIIEDLEPIGKSPTERILNALFNSKKIIIQKDGFYICEYNKNGNTVYRKHDDCITHWMPLPEVPTKEEI